MPNEFEPNHELRLCDGELRPFIPPSWFHEKGIHKVLKKLEPRLPDVSGKLFLTFTTDPKLFKDAESAFECSRDKLRKLFYRLRKGVEWEGKRYRIDAPYCVKVEFHENGWAHYHVIFLTRRFLPGPLLNHLWDYGRTNVARISQDEFRYLLKYVTKAASLPDWVLNRGRLRVFQSSRGFLKPIETKPKPTEQVKLVDVPKRKQTSTLGERLEKWQHKGLLRIGESYSALQFKRPFSEVVGDEILFAAEQGRYLGNLTIQFTNLQQIEPLSDQIL